jgi:Fur family transcriptional regulator, ferric uptake regulator
MVRRTRQKDAIQTVLEDQDNPLTPAEIHALAGRMVSGIGMATVYRSLRTLVDEKKVVAVEIPGQPPRYERADKGHHHHFVCRSCDGVFELEKCASGIQKMAPDGFVVEDHEITLYGICGDCLQRAKKRKAA